MLMADAEAVAEDRQLGGGRGTSEQRHGEGAENYGGFDRHSRGPIYRWPIYRCRIRR
jgi:hypothetical protein